MRLNLICFAFQIGSGGMQQGSSPLFDPGALSLALTNVVDKLHRKNKQVSCLCFRCLPACVAVGAGDLVRASGGFKSANAVFVNFSLHFWRSCRAI